MKSKKAEKIKKCLKIGVPVAVLGIGAATAAISLSCQPMAGEVPSKFITGGIPPRPLEDPRIVFFEDSDFSTDLSKLSVSGEKKLNKYLDEHYGDFWGIEFSRCRDPEEELKKISVLREYLTAGLEKYSDGKKRRANDILQYLQKYSEAAEKLIMMKENRTSGVIAL